MNANQIKKNIKKLQNALLLKGYIYKINTYQFYSVQQDRLITGYKVTDMGNKEKINTCSNVELLKWFANEWKNCKKCEGD